MIQKREEKTNTLQVAAQQSLVLQQSQMGALAVALSHKQQRLLQRMAASLCSYGSRSNLSCCQ